MLEGSLFVDSPSGSFVAVVFVRDCGARTTRSAQISILKKSENLPNDGGNIAVFGDEKVDVSWKDNKHLVVEYDGKAKVFLLKPEYLGIHIIPKIR